MSIEIVAVLAVALVFDVLAAAFGFIGVPVAVGLGLGPSFALVGAWLGSRLDAE